MAQASTATQRDLFAAGLPLPEGFACREEILTRAEERELAARLETLPFAPFEFHGFLGKRRIVSYGYRYEYSGRGALRESAEIPGFLLPLRERAAAFAGLEAPRLRQALVTEYAPGAGIGWHRDKPMFEDVVAFSLLAPCNLRFRRKRGSQWQRRTLTVEARSAYLLRGPSRREWEHSVPPVEALRYSVTFRNFTDER